MGSPIPGSHRLVLAPGRGCQFPRVDHLSDVLKLVLPQGLQEEPNSLVQSADSTVLGSKVQTGLQSVLHEEGNLDITGRVVDRVPGGSEVAQKQNNSRKRTAEPSTTSPHTPIGKAVPIGVRARLTLIVNKNDSYHSQTVCHAVQSGNETVI